MYRIADKNILKTFFNRDRILHVYGLADLDDVLFRHCEFFGDTDGSAGDLSAVFYIFSGLTVPCLVALGNGDREREKQLFQNVCRNITGDVYSLLNTELMACLPQSLYISKSCPEQRMWLADRVSLPDLTLDRPIQLLTAADESAIRTLIDQSGNESWFETSMLKYRQTWGVRIKDQLVAMTGTHVFSPAFGVAAIGNVVTHPDYRGQGLATALVTHQCRQMPEEILTIGLNVRPDNLPAVRSYEKVGFRRHAVFSEAFISIKKAPLRVPVVALK